LKTKGLREKMDRRAFRTNYDSEWLGLLKDFAAPLAGVASLITTSIPGSGLTSSDDKAFFLYYFMERTLQIAQSVALLVENEQYHEAGVAARTALEGQFYLAEYKRDRSLATKRRRFAVYEGYHEIYRQNYRNELIKQHKNQKEQNIEDEATAIASAEAAAKAAADKQLDYDRKMVGEQVIKESLAQFPIENYRLSWYGRKLSQLIESLRNEASNKPEELPKELEELLGQLHGEDPLGDQFNLIYHRFSLVAHWSPWGVLDWENNSSYVDAAITATLHCLQATATLVNDEYNLPYSDALRDMMKRYNQKGIDVMQRRKAQN
jgi:hypothetical protein